MLFKFQNYMTFVLQMKCIWQCLQRFCTCFCFLNISQLLCDCCQCVIFMRLGNVLSPNHIVFHICSSILASKEVLNNIFYMDHKNGKECVLKILFFCSVVMWMCVKFLCLNKSSRDDAVPFKYSFYLLPSKVCIRIMMSICRTCSPV